MSRERVGSAYIPAIIICEFPRPIDEYQVVGVVDEFHPRVRKLMAKPLDHRRAVVHVT